MPRKRKFQSHTTSEISAFWASRRIVNVPVAPAVLAAFKIAAADGGVPYPGRHPLHYVLDVKDERPQPFAYGSI